MLWTEELLRSKVKSLQNLSYSWQAVDKLYPTLKKMRRAAVLIPLYIKTGHVYVWLTKRSDSVTHDKGHVAFPGGMKDPEDLTPIDTCLREANEEVGLENNHVEVLAELVPAVNSRYYLITPIIGLVSTDFIPRPNSEVEVCFSLPLERFLWNSNHDSVIYNFKGQKGTANFFTDTIDGKDIVTWGLTASLCIKLAVVLFQRLPEFKVYPEIVLENPFAIYEFYLKKHEENLLNMNVDEILESSKL